VGLEALCVGRKGDQVGEGKLQLETDFMLFRGAFRLKIPLADLQSVRAESGQLLLSCGDGPVSFELGPAATKWADKILHPPQRLDKLGVKPGLQVVILGVADQRFHDEAIDRGANVSMRSRKDSDLVFLGAQKKADLRRLAAARRALKADGAIWVVYPKGIEDITEGDVLRAGKEAGFVDVKVTSFSSTHTALKFVIPVAKRCQDRS
jgi:hypothetical protein